VSNGLEPRVPRVWLGPGRPGALLAPLERAGALAPSPQAANVVVWTAGPEDIAGILHPDVAWVQLVSAGVETWLSTGMLDQARIWTNASGAFGERVAEHVLALILAAAKNLPRAIRANEWQETLESAIFRGSTVGVVGAGAIGRATLMLLRPFGVRCVALTRSGRNVPEADVSLAANARDDLLRMSDFVVLAAPLTPATKAFIGAREIELLGPSGFLINVARGGLIDTEALVAALKRGRLGGACLDVTDPEPLPPDHPLWTLPNVLITPHIANPPGTHFDALAPLVLENIARFRRGDKLSGVIDVGRGY
jgi:phosphoglycerate dehydrogenase-like enzyme